MATGRADDGARERDTRKRASTTTTINNNNKKPINSTTTSRSTKPTPNYLKPTFSSRLNPSTTTRSTTTTTTRATTRAATKSSIIRRQALDAKPTRPTSSSSYTPSKTSTKPMRELQKSSRASVASPSIRRSLSNRVPSVSAAPKPLKKRAPKSVASNTSHVDTCDQDPLDNMIVDFHKDPDEVLSLTDISEMSCPEAPLGDPIMMTIENQETHVEESVEAMVVEYCTNVEEKHVVMVEPKEEEEKQEKEQVAVKDGSLKKQDMSSNNQSGTKKEAQDYNEVIEETASKLMENKRNKVRALAGAFETVISLQDPK